MLAGGKRDTQRNVEHSPTHSCKVQLDMKGCAGLEPAVQASLLMDKTCDVQSGRRCAWPQQATGDHVCAWPREATYVHGHGKSHGRPRMCVDKPQARPRMCVAATKPQETTLGFSFSCCVTSKPETFVQEKRVCVTLLHLNIKRGTSSWLRSWQDGSGKQGNVPPRRQTSWFLEAVHRLGYMAKGNEVVDGIKAVIS